MSIAAPVLSLGTSLISNALNMPQTDPYNARTKNKFQGALAGLAHLFTGFKKGGKIPRTGVYTLHKGELVIPSHLVNKVPMSVKNAIKRGKKK